MNLNMNFSQRCVVDSLSLPWQTADSPLTKQRWIERADEANDQGNAQGEGAMRTTRILQYAPGATLNATHQSVEEEILVLVGRFSDDQGDYGPGLFLKNPPGLSSARLSEVGCTLFVKQRQPGKTTNPDASNSARVAVDTVNATWRPGLVAGLSVLPLHEFGTEHTAMVRWAPETWFSPHRHYGGEEIYVLEGVFEDEHGRYPAGTWIRSPHLSQHQPFSREGCLILVKVGHLPESDG
jgi:anti-sigma factor ChrR (cupin superfamily)